MSGLLATGILTATGPASDTVATALQAYELVGAALGIFISYVAYRGYRGNDSRPMLFIALGFALALGLPFVLTLLYLASPITGWQVALQATTQTVEIAGLLCILYALRM